MGTRARGFSQTLTRAWLGHGPLATALLPLAWLYGAVRAARSAAYRHGWRRSQKLAVPVVVVGNLIAGGAGKTPTVLALVDMLRRHGRRPGILSRGYGGTHDGVLEVTRDTPASRCGDEPLLMHLRSRAPLAVGRDRVGAGRLLLRTHPELDVLVSDDGLQHLALARDAQVIVFDERGVGNAWLLPAGPLREPLPARVPARSLVVYNAAKASTPLPGSLARRDLAGVVDLAEWWRGGAASVEALRSLRGHRVLAAAGMAHPRRFFDMLSDQGLQVEELALPDHHDFATLPWPAETGTVLVTEKDAVKIDPDRVGTTKVWVVPLDFGLDAAFEAALIALLPPTPTPHGNSPA